MDSTRHGQDSLSSDPEKGEKRSGGMGMGRLEASTSRTTSYNPLEGRIKRIKDVTLQDVLANRLATPLSLRDFELFLVHRTRSVENLYAECWHKRYVELYAAAKPAERTPDQIAVLSQAYHLATDFIEPANPLELNLNDSTRRRLAEEVTRRAEAHASDPSVEPFLPPSAFADLIRESRSSLSTSFTTFLRDRAGNSQEPRNEIAFLSGLFLFVVSLLPIMVCPLAATAWGWRFVGLPFTFWGVSQMSAARRRTCLLIFLANKSRQLYEYEQAEGAAHPSFPHSFSSLDDPEKAWRFPSRTNTDDSLPSPSSPPIHFLSFQKSVSHHHHSHHEDSPAPNSSSSSPSSSITSHPALPASPSAFITTLSSPSPHNLIRTAVFSESFASPPHSLRYWPPSRASADPSVYFSPSHMDDLIRRMSAPSPVWKSGTGRQEEGVVRREQERRILIAGVAGAASCVALLLPIFLAPNRGGEKWW